MIAIGDDTTIGEAFSRAAEAYASNPFLAVPVGTHRPYHRDGYEITFAEAAREVQALTERSRAASYGPGHRVAMLLDNRPEHFLHKLALNTIGVSAVPINPDYRANEIAYLLENAEVDLALVAAERREQLDAGMNVSTHRAPIVVFDDGAPLPSPRKRAESTTVTAASEASVLYTSGTTGRPKGCMLSHGYELASGAWYANGGGLAAFRPEGERIYNPLPVYHPRRCSVTAMDSSRISRRRAGSTSPTCCRRPARRRSRSTRSFLPARTRARCQACSTCARARHASGREA